MRKLLINLALAFCVGIVMLSAGIKVTNWQYIAIYVLLTAYGINTAI